MIDLTTVINAIIALLAAVVTAFVVPWIKANATIKQQEMLKNVYRTIVYAAEQIYGDGKGAEKLAYVKSQLEAKGYTVDIDLIESTVKANFGHWPDIGGEAIAVTATEQAKEAQGDA